MTDPAKPRRKVVGAHPSPSPSAPTSPHPLRARARIDPSTLPSPLASSSHTRPNLRSTPSSARIDPSTLASTLASRPTLRSTPSTASIKSAAHITRARSPAPPIPHVSTPEPSPVVRVRAAITRASTPDRTPDARTPSRAGVAGSSKVRPPVTPTPRTRSPDRISPTRSDLARPHLSPHTLDTMSLPPSPLPHAPRYRSLPIHPSHRPHPLPLPPSEPDLPTVALPALTPTRTLSSDDGDVVDTGSRGRLSGSTAVSEASVQIKGLGLQDNAGDTQDVVGDTQDGERDGDDEDDEDVQEAKVNRKIADLEISNASLMAINRSLEATRAKQRTEILKLRRMLRESLNPQPLSMPLLSPSMLSPTFADSVDDTPFEEEMVDPELEERWSRMEELMQRMLRRGEEAVRKGLEEVKVASKVLGWDEVEGLRDEERGEDGASVTQDPAAPL